MTRERRGDRRPCFRDARAFQLSGLPAFQRDNVAQGWPMNPAAVWGPHPYGLRCPDVQRPNVHPSARAVRRSSDRI